MLAIMEKDVFKNAACFAKQHVTVTMFLATANMAAKAVGREKIV